MAQDTSLPRGRRGDARTGIRRDLLQHHLRLQRELIEGDPACSAYQATIHAFRQSGYALIAAGFEDDLDRLLRLRILEGGRTTSSGRACRTSWPELTLIEANPI